MWINFQIPAGNDYPKGIPAVIPPIALRDLLRRVRAKMKPNPRLRLLYDPDTEDIWKYYKVIKITPVVIDKLLVILLTIPNHRQHIRTKHIPHPQPSSYTPKAQNSHYISPRGGLLCNRETWSIRSIANEWSIQVCLESDLVVCTMGQALYPTMHITWCIYATIHGR